MATIPKRPLSAYMLFAADVREIVRAENPGAGVAEIGKSIGDRWKNLDENEKREYQVRHSEAKKAYDEAIAALKADGVDTGSSHSKANDVEEDDDDALKLPLSRVKRIIKLDPDVSKVTGDAAYLITAATELILTQLTKEACAVATERGRKTVSEVDFARAVQRIPALAYLAHDLRVPTAAEEAAAKAAKQAAKSSASAPPQPPATDEGEGGQEGETDGMQVEGQHGDEAAPAKPAPSTAPSIAALFAKIAAAGPQEPARRVKVGGGQHQQQQKEEEEEELVGEERHAQPAAPTVSKKDASKSKGKGSKGLNAPRMDRFLVPVASREEAVARLEAQIQSAHGDEIAQLAEQRRAEKAEAEAKAAARKSGRGSGRRQVTVEGVDEEQEGEEGTEGTGRGGGAGANGQAEAEDDEDEFDLGMIRRQIRGKAVRPRKAAPAKSRRKTSSGQGKGKGKGEEEEDDAAMEEEGGLQAGGEDDEEAIEYADDDGDEDARIGDRPKPKPKAKPKAKAKTQHVAVGYEEDIEEEEEE